MCKSDSVNTAEVCRKGACVVTTQTKARPDYNKETGLLRGLPKLSSFSREYTEYAGGRGGGVNGRI